MKRTFALLLLPLLVLYAVAFRSQETLFSSQRLSLSYSPTYQVLKACTGYWRQLAAEMIFIRAAVFLGGVKAGTDPLSYAPALANNYQQITKLYPAFIDSYYYSQAFLPSAGPEFAKITNEILTTGNQSHPDNFVFWLFKGMNHLQNMDDPAGAAEVFAEASKVEGAPPLFQHLAAILAAEGGNLQASWISLSIMRKAEENEAAKKRYTDEMLLVEKAIQLQEAALKYKKDKGEFPQAPEQLIPQYAVAVPDFMPFFELIWEPPQIKLKRPDPKKLDEAKAQEKPVPFL